MSSKYRIIPLGGGGMDPSTKYGASISMSMDQDYILSVQLLDQDGNALGSEQTVDLPLESVVVGGSYDSASKSLILTLDNGNTVTIPVGDLVSGLQTEITAQNPLSADLVADGTNNKVFTAAEKTKLSGIETGAQVNVKPDWNAAAGSAAEILNKPTIPAAQVNSDWNANSGVAQILNKPSIPTSTSDLTNDSGFITANDIPAQVNADWNSNSGVSQILNKPTLGTMAAESASDYTKTSGLATVATSGSYNDLTNKPTIPTVDVTAAGDNTFTGNNEFTSPTTMTEITIEVNDDEAEPGTTLTYRTDIRDADIALEYSDGTNTEETYITNGQVMLQSGTEQEHALNLNIITPTYLEVADNSSNDSTRIEASGITVNGNSVVTDDQLATVATTGDYSDLSNTPSIPTATSDLTNDSGFITSSDIPAQVNADWNAVSGSAQILNKPTIPAAQVNADWNASSGVAQILNKPTIPTVNDATLTIQKNGTAVGTFTANQATAETINITVPTSAADVSALPASTKYAAAMTLSVNTTTYVVTAQLKDQDGNNLGTAQTIDLPLESVVVNGSYDSTNKKIVLTLQSGSTIDIPIADLVAGLQSTIDAQHPLNADYLTSGTTNKVYTATEQTKLSGIETGAQVNVKPDWNAASGTAAEILHKPSIPTATSQLTNDSGFITSSDIPAQVNADWNAVSGAAQILNKPTIPAAQVNSDWNATTGKAQILNKPTIPTATSQLTNDSGFITSSDIPAQVNADWNAVSGAAQILNKPTIPAAQVNADWSASTGVSRILNKPSTIAVVVTFTDQTTATYNLYHS